MRSFDYEQRGERSGLGLCGNPVQCDFLPVNSVVKFSDAGARRLSTIPGRLYRHFPSSHKILCENRRLYIILLSNNYYSFIYNYLWQAGHIRLNISIIRKITLTCEAGMM
jgi:hypothetical protein